MSAFDGSRSTLRRRSTFARPILPFVDLGSGRSAVALALGEQHACAILDNDDLKCWGDNGFGQPGMEDIVRRGDGPNEMGDDLLPVVLEP